jgi:hypothetical protein
MRAASEGWFFYTRQRTTGESNATMTKRFPLDVQATLCAKYKDGSNYGRSRYSCDTELNRGGSLSSPGCVELAGVPVLGRERFEHLFTRIGSSGVNYPLTLQATASGANPYRSAGALLWHWEDEGVPSVVAAWKLSSLPENMHRAIKSSLLAPREEWPNDRGVGFCLSQIHASDAASDLEKKSAAQRLAYVAKSMPPSSIRTGIRGEDRRAVALDGGGVGTAVAVVGGLGIAGLIAWALLK